MALSVKTVTNIVIQVSLPENAWHEVAEIDIVFGQEINIIYNSSYRRGFGQREEKTVTVVVLKNPEINPCVMCEDVAGMLAEQLSENDDITPEEAIEKIQKAIEEYNNLV